MQIQVEIDGKLVEVSKRRLFELAETGEIEPETKIVVNGQKSIAANVRGILFGKSRREPDTILAEIDGKLVEVTKRRLFDLAETWVVEPETKIVVNGQESIAANVQGIKFGEAMPDTALPKLSMVSGWSASLSSPVQAREDQTLADTVPPTNNYSAFGAWVGWAVVIFAPLLVVGILLVAWHEASDAVQNGNSWWGAFGGAVLGGCVMLLFAGLLFGAALELVRKFYSDAKQNEFGGCCGCLLLIVLMFGGVAIYESIPEPTPEQQAIDAAENEEIAAFSAACDCIVQTVNNPNSANFCSFREATVLRMPGGSFNVSGYVEVKNAFNATVRWNWRIDVKRVGGDRWRGGTPAMSMR